MKNWYRLATKKILYLMRGCPGCGKSTVARAIAGLDQKNIFSTDTQFSPNPEEYTSKFNAMIESKDLTPLYQAHRINEQKAEEAMSRGESPIVIDNTNIEAWMAKAYVEAAKRFGYEVKIMDIGTAGLDSKTLAERNKHGVPQEAIERMYEKYNREGPLTVEKILQSKRPEEIK